MRSRSRFTNCRCVIGIVLAAGALQSVRGNELGGDHASIEIKRLQFAAPVMSTAASLHCDKAALGQIDAQGYEPFASEHPGAHHLAGLIYGMHLNKILGQINADTCNLAHGTSPFKGCRFTSKQRQSWHSMPLPESGKSLRIHVGASTGEGVHPIAYIYECSCSDETSI
ncbi:hypothetical protein FQZ97_923550 [compost metagenome]